MFLEEYITINVVFSKEDAFLYLFIYLFFWKRRVNVVLTFKVNLNPAFIIQAGTHSYEVRQLIS